MKNEWIRGFLILACILAVAFLIYKSMILEKTIPEYAITFFASTASLLIGYSAGVDK
ncbi:MAG: hypothetical protein V1740_01880 [Candidatus Woesearchaeota archaeon]